MRFDTRYELTSWHQRIVSAHCMMFFFFSSRRRHTRFDCDWSSDVCSSDLGALIRITAHETDIAAILHYLNDVARKQSAFAIFPCRPMQHCAAFEVPAAID